MEYVNWRQSSLCAEHISKGGKNLWFPPEEGDDDYIEEHNQAVAASRKRTAAAKEICADCPVRQECLDAAVEYEHGVYHKVRFGIWGGTTPYERWGMEFPDKQETAKKIHAVARAEYRARQKLALAG